MFFYAYLYVVVTLYLDVITENLYPFQDATLLIHFSPEVISKTFKTFWRILKA